MCFSKHFSNAAVATGTKGAERLGTKAGRGFSLAIGTMLAAILISSVSSAETSPRGELEDVFGQVTAILSVATNAKQAREDVRYLARALFDGREAARRTCRRR